MPKYILEAKKRLGMIKQPHIAPNIEPKKNQQQTGAEQQAPPAESHGSTEPKKSDKHWQMWDNPSTPDKIREIRARLGDDRYRKLQRAKTTLTNYETKIERSQRPKTSFEIKTETTANENSFSPSVKVTTTVAVNDNEAAALAQALEPTYQIPVFNDIEPKSYVYNNLAPMTTTTSAHLPLSAVSTNYFDLPNPNIIHTTATTLPPFTENYENYSRPQSFLSNQNSQHQNAELAALQTVYDNDNFIVNNENQLVSEGNFNDNENDYYNIVPNTQVKEV